MSQNKTIAKNTFYLYIRMFVNLAVSLYTSRLVLAMLGIADFGIYNVVGGVIVLFSFLNGSMIASTQRFINVEMASGDWPKVNKVFNLSLHNHLYIALLAFFLAETIGLWFLNFQLNIPAERMLAANWVYQFSVITLAVDVLRVPYNAIVLANEKMSYYAYISIYETCSKLLIIYLLNLLQQYDSLIVYAFLYLLVNISTNVVLYLYCRRKFPLQVRLKAYLDKKARKAMLFFSAWILLGQVASLAANQGLAMLLNIFYGVLVNAALGIANQVNAAVYGFISNFQIAFNPQIVQSYTLGEQDRTKHLVLNASKYSMFLMAIISVPLLFSSQAILDLWLGNNVPQYAEEFLKVIIFCSLLDALAGPFWMAASAIGSIRVYNITLTAINLCTLPLAYLLLKQGYSPLSVYWLKFIILLILHCFRYLFIDGYLNFHKSDFRRYLGSILLIFTYLFAIVWIAQFFSRFPLFTQIGYAVLFLIGLLLLIAFIGLQKQERQYITRFILKRKEII